MKVKHTEKANNEPQHSDLTDILADIREHLGLVLVAEAGHGKSFASASMIQQAQKDENLTVIVLTPSTIWRRKLWAGNYIKVGTSEFNPIVPTKKNNIDVVPYLRDAVHVDLDKKWAYIKNGWFEQLLQSKESLCMEIKYKNGRRIKAFESVVLQYIYSMQEKAIDENPQYSHHYLICIEEIQNSFGTYSMNADDSLELFTIFTQSRSDANIHYIAIGQRLNDISCKVVERLRPLIGLTLGENSLRKLKAMIPDEETKKRIQALPKRHWIYLNGKDNPEIEIPEFIRHGAPHQLKPPMRQPIKPTMTKEKEPLLLRYLKFLNLFNPYQGSTQKECEETEEYETEDEKDDALIL